MLIQDSAGSYNYGVSRASALNFYIDGTCIVPVDSSGLFRYSIGGLTSDNTVLCILGYFV